jgi:hypothetical protein
MQPNPVFAIALSTPMGMTNRAPMTLDELGGVLAAATNWIVTVDAGIRNRSVPARSREGTMESVANELAFDANVVLTFDQSGKRVSFSLS